MQSDSHTASQSVSQSVHSRSRDRSATRTSSRGWASWGHGTWARQSNTIMVPSVRGRSRDAISTARSNLQRDCISVTKPTYVLSPSVATHIIISSHTSHHPHLLHLESTTRLEREGIRNVSYPLEFLYRA